MNEAISKKAINLTARYLRAQEKRAEVEFGGWLLNADDDVHEKVASELATHPDTLKKQAFGENAAQYLRDLIQSAGQTASSYKERLPQLLDSPVGSALAGGALGAGAGGLVSGLSGGSVLGGAAQGGIAGGAIGGGASLIGKALKNRSNLPNTDQIAQLNDAINGATNDSGLSDLADSGTYTGRLGMLLGGGYGMNLIDRFMGGRNHGAALLNENVNTMSSRMDLIKRLEGWAGDKGRQGGESINAFVKLLENQDSPGGAQALMQELADKAKGGNITGGNAALRGSLQNTFGSSLQDILGDGVDINSVNLDPIVRALRETQEPGLQFMPRNILGRSGLGANRLFSGAAGEALGAANTALSQPRLRGRVGALASALGLAGAFGADTLNSMNSPREIASPEDVARIRDMLNSP